jgi:hypothetical protein
MLGTSANHPIASFGASKQNGSCFPRTKDDIEFTNGGREGRPGSSSGRDLVSVGSTALSPLGLVLLNFAPVDQSVTR